MENNEINNSAKNNAFEVPDGYFEKLNLNVISNLYPAKNKFIFWKKNSKWLAAASVALILGLSFWTKKNNSILPINYASITEEEFAAFEENIEISDEELTELVSTDDVDSLYKNTIKQINYIEEEKINAIDTLDEYSLFEDEIEI